MSISVNHNNNPASILRTDNTSNSSTQAVTGNNNSVDFNYEELNKLFIEKGLSALLEKITELQNAGLVTDIVIETEAEGRTTVTFKADDKEYKFKGAAGDEPQLPTNDSTLKTDNIDNADKTNETDKTNNATDPRALTQDELEARRKNSRYYNYDGPDRRHETDYDEIIVDGVTYRIPLTPNSFSDSSVFEDVIKEMCNYFNITPANITKLMNSLTDEQKEYINAHPEKFSGVQIDQYDSAWFGTPEMMERHLDNGDFYSADEMYYQCVKAFSGYLNEDSDWGPISSYMTSVVPETVSNPSYNVKVNGDSIEFTDKTVKAIMDFLKENADKFGSTEKNRYDYLGCADAGYCKMLGLTPDDTEATIWQKINDFCYKYGSTDGKSMLMEDYYNACAENQTVSFSNSNYPNTSIATYETCQKVVNYNAETIRSESKEAKSKYTNVDGTTADVEVDNYSPSMAVGGISTDSDEDTAFKALKEKYMQELADRIKSSNGYNQVHAGWFQTGDIPIYALVDVDDNGNITLSENAKTYLKNYLQSLANAEKADIELYDKNIELLRANGSSVDSVYTQCAQKEFLELFGLSAIPYGGDYKNHPQMEAWIENIESIANDDSKIEQLLTTFVSSIGSTDGKTTTLENYYDTLANNGIYEHLTTYGQSKTTYKTNAEIEALAKNGAEGSYLESLKQKYPEIYQEYGYYIQDSYDTYNGVIRFDTYIDSDDEDEAPALGAENRAFQYLWAKGPALLAAGVVDGDSFTEQRRKLTELAQKMGAIQDGPAVNIDIKDMMNYLLGDNAEGVNYFDKYIQNRNAKAISLSNTKLETVQQNPNIDVVRSDDDYSNDYWENYGVSDASQTETANNQAKVTEISYYIESLLDPIYQKYYKDNGNDGYENFVLGQSEWSNPDSGDYAHTTWSWKDDSIKQAFVKEVEEAIQKALAKYSDSITNISFDGQRVIFSTVYDEDINAKTTDPVHGVNYNRANQVVGDIYIPGTKVTKDSGEFEAAVDTTINYTNPPKTINNNFPDGAPSNVDGKEVVKTAWEGIYATSDSSKVYLWEAKAQKYLEINNWTSQAAESFAQGDPTDLPFIGGVTGSPTVSNYQNYEVNQILLSLVYGYNRTDDPTIFEKDGKYYQLDYETKRHKEGLEGYKDSLREMTFANNSTVTVQAKNAPSNTVENNTVDKTEVVDKPTEEIIYKSDEVVTEMQAAAEKLNLTSAKTTGTYYQFSEQGTYLYVWNPENKKFKAFSINTRNTDGSINKEFTQAGKAINRTETNIYYEALLEAYKNGYNFTANYPWVCEKDGIYYEYDKENGCFKKRAE